MANHGLFIGINYEGTSNALRGCINDAADWRDAFINQLTTWKLLLERDATKAGIITSVRHTLDRCRPGDWAIITLSSHGTQLGDRSGDEADRKDEAAVPYDYQGGLLSDDEQFAILSQRTPGVRVLYVTDCCHSGTMTRAMTLPRRVPLSALTADMCAHDVDAMLRGTRSGKNRIRGNAAESDIVHLSGCRDDEFSYDAKINGRDNGAMSRYAINCLRPSATFQSWFDDLRRNLPQPGKYEQSPQLNCSREARSWFVPGFEPVAVDAPVDVENQPRTSVRMKTEDGVEWRAVKWERVR